LDQGDGTLARSLYEDCLKIRQELRDKGGIAACLEGLASVMLVVCSVLTAAILFGVIRLFRGGR
jgi:hypothetical protein